MKKTLLLAAALAATLTTLSACNRADEANQIAVIESYGFTDVEMTGWAWYGCSEDDDLSYAFKATDSRGRPVEGALCSGLMLKGATVRITSF